MSARPTDLLCAMLVGLPAALAPAAILAETVTVNQKDRRFEIQHVEIVAGDIVSFTNDDRFLHQIYANSPRFSFDSAEQFPGEVVDVRFPREGAFEVRCGIHPKMLLKVEVSPAPEE
ncbi:hypothetical protein [uncultured Jannaschia sp.]|uniref:hypothetical protein n=1 Tax=uncultured Jannaschia sp. TaxID=293347 RepID=UPI002617F70D|nr:hypothetical protein [uncultured Jannaschia sp.]